MENNSEYLDVDKIREEYPFLRMWSDHCACAVYMNIKRDPTFYEKCLKIRSREIDKLNRNKL